MSVSPQRRVLPPKSGSLAGQSDGFTLIEMLVVIGLIALIAGLAAPAFKTKNITLDVAHRQLADDLNRARQLAISTRSTVYVVFMPLLEKTLALPKLPRSLTLAETSLLATRQARGYAFFSRRSVGAQPGQEELRYLSEWRELPEGVFIATNKFSIVDTGVPATSGDGSDDFKIPAFLPMDRLFNVPVPTPDGPLFTLGFPYIAFDYSGALVLSDHGDVITNPARHPLASPFRRAVIPLVTGSVSPQRAIDAGTQQSTFPLVPANILIKAPYDTTANYFSRDTYLKWVVVDGLTGRARVAGGEIAKNP